MKFKGFFFLNFLNLPFLIFAKGGWKGIWKWGGKGVERVAICHGQNSVILSKWLSVTVFDVAGDYLSPSV